MSLQVVVGLFCQVVDRRMCGYCSDSLIHIGSVLQCWERVMVVVVSGGFLEVEDHLLELSKGR